MFTILKKNRVKLPNIGINTKSWIDKSFTTLLQKSLKLEISHFAVSEDFDFFSEELLSAFVSVDFYLPKMDPKDLEKKVDSFLIATKRDFIDLAFISKVTFSNRLIDVLYSLQRLQEGGKVLAFGLNEYKKEAILFAVQQGVNIDVYKNTYDETLHNICRENNICFMADVQIAKLKQNAFQVEGIADCKVADCKLVECLKYFVQKRIPFQTEILTVNQLEEIINLKCLLLRG